MTVQRRRTKHSDWYVAIDHSSSAVHEPPVIGTPEIHPRVNERPEIRIPTTKKDKWDDDGFENVPADVYYKGVPQPVDRLADVTTEVVDETVRSVLIFRGGEELTQRIERDYDFKAIHTAVEDIITTETGYTANVDSPQTTTTTNTEIQGGHTKSAFEDNYASTDPTNPIVAVTGDSYGNGDVLKCAQTGFVHEAEDDFSMAGTQSDADASAGTAEIHTNLSKSTDDTVAYEIPASDVGVAVRLRHPDDPDGDGGYEGNGFDVNVDGETVLSVADGLTFLDAEYTWVSDVGRSSNVGNGTVTVEFDGSKSANNYTTYVDLIVLYDARYHDAGNFDNSVDANGYLATPTEYPIGATKNNAPTRTFQDATTIEAITGGRIDELNANDQSEQFRVSLSNDSGANWTSSSSAPYETDFADPAPSLRWRVRLGGTSDTRSTATPTQGYAPQKLGGFALQADTEDTPLVINRTYDASIEDVLTKLADRGDFVWSFTVDSSGNGQVEWTQPGQRTDTSTPDIASHSSTKRAGSETIVEKAIVYGKAVPVTNEEITVSTGSWVDLANDRILEGSEYVVDASTRRVYERGSEYEVDHSQGRIKATGGGKLDDGTTVDVSYQHQIRNSYTASGVSNPQERSFRIPELTTDRAAGNAARRLVEEGQVPAYTATVELPSDETGWAVVESIDPPEVPTGGRALRINDVVNTPAGVELKLGTREDLQAFAEQIGQQVETLSDFA